MDIGVQLEGEVTKAAAARGGTLRGRKNERRVKKIVLISLTTNTNSCKKMITDYLLRDPVRYERNYYSFPFSLKQHNPSVSLLFIFLRHTEYLYAIVRSQ